VTLKHQGLEEYRRRPNYQRVLLQLMPTDWFERLPSSDKIWTGGHESLVREVGWQLAKVTNSGGEDTSLMRNYQWHREKNFPPVLAEMMKHHDCTDISMFCGQSEGNDGSLGWHFDDYYVWAFNIEGLTKWEWFDPKTGEIKSLKLEPGYILTMPMGITHRVIILSEERTSVSLITRFGVPEIRVPKE
jgi:hypothetical protein